MKHSSETLGVGVGVFYWGCLALIKDSDIQKERRGTVKKIPDRRGLQQSKVKL
jgi:hypothetical protein